MKLLFTAGITKQTTIILVVSAIVIIATAVLLANPVMQNPSGQASTTSTASTISTTGSAGGSNDTSVWSKYLGYIPQGYTIAPHLTNAPVFPCPTGMSTAQCQQFQGSCGNGVCDPNETCSSCSLDCGASGSQVCDPYTGRPGAPAQVCQLRAGG